MCQNIQPNNNCQNDLRQSDDPMQTIYKAAWKLYFAELRKVVAQINLHLAIVGAAGGRSFLERAGHPTVRITKPARCCSPWIAIYTSWHGRRKRVRLGQQSAECIGEGPYFIVGSDGGRFAFEVPKAPIQPSLAHPPAASAATPPENL